MPPIQIRIRLQQQDTLRDLALNSMDRFLEFIQSACACDAVVRSTAVVDLGSSGCGRSGEAAAGAASRRSAPLLVSEMLVVREAGDKLGYSTGPELVAARLMALFERGLQRLQVGVWGC